MTEKHGPKPSMIDWAMRVVVALLLPVMGVNASEQAETNARIGIVMERQAQAARIDQARSTHESRIKVIEESRFKDTDARNLRAYFDGELLDMWKELQAVKAAMPVAHGELRDRLEAVMTKLEERIRALENHK